jgi:hypothetical protein
MSTFWDPLYVDHLPSSHPGFIDADVRALLNTDFRFRDALTPGEADAIAAFVGWYRTALADYMDAVEAERVAWQYYESLPITHRDKSLAHDAANIASIAREASGDELRAGTAKGTALVLAVLESVLSRSGFSLVERAGISRRAAGLPDVTSEVLGRLPVPINPIGDLLQKGLRDFLRTFLEGGLGSLLPSGIASDGGPGLTGWTSDLGRNRRSAGSPTGGGSVIAVAARVGPSSSASPGGGIDPGRPDTFAVSGGRSASEHSRGVGAVAGPGTRTVVKIDQQPVDTGKSKQRTSSTNTYGPTGASAAMSALVQGVSTSEEDAAIVKGLKAGSTPNPVVNPISLSNDPFIASMQVRALDIVGRAIPAPVGPVLSLSPDGGIDYGAGPGTIDWEMLDPVAPYAGGEYEPRRRGPRPGGKRARITNPAILALYPDGSPSGGNDEDDETARVVGALVGNESVPLPPREDPAAGRPNRGVVVAVSSGVASRTMNFSAASLLGSGMGLPRR